ncbi:putative EMP1-like protein, partial [Plasmodium gaboni]
SSSAREFLEKKLKKMCPNSGNTSGTDCNCMNTTTSQNSGGTEMPKCLDDVTQSEYKKQCECTSPAKPVAAKPVDTKSVDSAPASTSQQDASQSQTQTSHNGTQTTQVSANTPGQTTSSTGGGVNDPPGEPSGNQGGNNQTDPGSTVSNGSASGTSGPTTPVSLGGTGTSSNGQTNGQIPGSSPSPASSGSHNPDASGPPTAPGVHPATPDLFKDLDTCLLNEKDTCNKYKTSSCRKKNFSKDLEFWNKNFLKDSTIINSGVLVPPRRTKICFTNINTWKKHTRIRTQDDFTKLLLDAASTEAKLLSEYYNPDNKKVLQAMKYSFADLGDMVKGDDMLEDLRTRNVKEIFEKICQNDNQCKISNTKDEEIKKKRKTWWDNNKKKVWNVMMCHYKGDEKSKHCDDYKEIDNEDQFLRWMTEWSRQFCEEKITKTSTLQKLCLEKNKNIHNSQIINKPSDHNCISWYNTYKDWLRSKKEQWKAWEEKYKKYKEKEKENVKDSTQSVSSPPGTSSQKGAEDYITSKCEQCKCNINNLDKMYEQLDKPNIDSIKKIVKEVHEDIPELKPRNLDEDIKSMNDFLQNVTTLAQTIEEKINPEASKLNQNKNQSNNSQGSGILTDLWKAIKDAVLPRVADTVLLGTYETMEAIDAATSVIPTAAEAGFKAGIVALEKIKTMLDATKPKIAKLVDPKTPGINPETVVTSTVPVGISVALGSIALLYYIKNKPKIPTTKLFRVIDIPQNDYGIPTKISTNRYVPYSRYKGKTYIYVEGDEPDDYIGDISSSDITSSSETEVEEMDINDIYKPLDPKYKTLIEVVLKPSRKTTHDVQDDTYMYQKHNNNKLTDNEWNQLKENFISQNLENIQKDLHNENIIDDNMYKDTYLNNVDNRFGEKPFITSIQDRFLNSNREDVTYNIDWNVPENINSTTNIMNNPKYVSNDQYTGSDLINDSLNSDQHIDIYDELLKRKENEMFGTKHTKTLSRTNSVATKKHNDSLKSPNTFM